ncbi:MAG: 4Fe-4S dicluster domain-containing protein [Betaproteobacteria bacterium]|nr:4Fe-4S dicluster domain-containing protein [Betaproteobacteria bacterium]NCU85059.1 4Fe-4S dicluster domain-containing protein [Betaproteobacteria bacterium]
MGMMFENVQADYDIVIVGSGPAGLSAASRAQERGNRYVLLEAEDHASDTIYKYQKGKHVMAEPGFLPLRSGMKFGEGKREGILGEWDNALKSQSINIAYKKKVAGIKRDDANSPFTITCEDGSSYTSRAVILGIGLQGNIRKLGVPGENLARVQYTLSDPDEFKDEVIVVVGAGDAGIENACALAKQNQLHLMNRDEEFTVCKDGNKNLALATEKSGKMTIWHSAFAARVEETGAEPPLNYVFNAKDGEHSIPCHRVVARCGAIPPRKLVESFGIQFPNPNPTSIPVLSESYESNVPGLFIVGALGGYPLIKQAMNQGYEVVETINGEVVEPVDEPLIRERLKAWKADANVGDLIDRMRASSPFFAAITKLQMREILLESTVKVLRKGEVVFAKGDYTNTFFSIAEGSVDVQISPDEVKPAKYISLPAGRFFGEMGLLSGRRRTATILAGEGCVLIETPRRTMLKLIASSDEVRKQIDNAFVRNAIINYIGSAMSPESIDALLQGGVELKRYNAKQYLFKEGDDADGLYLIRRGSVEVTRKAAGQDQALGYVAAGGYVGEMALIDDSKRSASVMATVLTEALVFEGARFKAEIERNPKLKETLQALILERTRANVTRADTSANSSYMAQFLVAQGVGDASNILVIDETKCVQCNNCETACAETHDGVSRLRRDVGPTLNHLHIPVACRHCENPHCMKDCPPDAISRGPTGEVFISDACIGCGNCERNCPYGVVQLAVQKKPKFGGGLAWLLFGLGKAPGDRAPDYDPNARKKAVKCDLCKEISGGPRCVNACPTGAAVRMSPDKLMALVASDN